MVVLDVHLNTIHYCTQIDGIKTRQNNRTEKEKKREEKKKIKRIKEIKEGGGIYSNRYSRIIIIDTLE